MTAGDVAKQALLELDPDRNRWTAATLVKYVADAQLLLVQMRPRVRLQTDGTAAVVGDVSVVGSTLVVGERWRAALVDYVVARALREDEADTENMARADKRFALFSAQVGL